MRLKNISAASMAEALEVIRRDFGEDAIIVTQGRGPGGKGVRVTIALEQTYDDDSIDFSAPEAPTAEALAALLRQRLAFHGVPKTLLERLVAAANGQAAQGVDRALAVAADITFSFAPLTLKNGGVLVFIGPPASGKTLAVAKMATRAKVAGDAFALITTDTVRAGAAAHLRAFAQILETDLLTASTGAELAEVIASLPKGTTAFVDTAGTNPYSEPDMDRLTAFTAAAGQKPILVMPAGGDVFETAEMARAFAGLGAQKMLVTRIDLTRRLGGILAAADAARVAFADVCYSSHAADGLRPLNPMALAQLVVADSRYPSAAKTLTGISQ
ncbi:MAG: GTP-binding protein [Magnetospiraceae bacterium]